MDLSFLDQEKNSEVLREFARLSIQENERLRLQIAEMQAASSPSAEQLRLIYNDRLSKLKRRLFGQGPEALDPSLKPRKTKEVLLHGESLNPDEDRGRQRTAKDRELASEVTHHAMESRELLEEAMSRGVKNPKASDWKELQGLYDESVEITIIERTYKKVVHRKKKYLYLPSRGTDKEVIVTARGPEKLYPGCGYSVDFAIAVACDKYQRHLPLNRQVEQMESRGLSGITAKTLWGLVEGLAAHGASVVESIRQDILSAPLAVHVDETPWPILSDHDSDGYLWVASNMAGSYYQFEPTRSGRIATEVLKGYQGPVMTDDYRGYDRLKRMPGLVLAHCWAHARRKFFDLLPHHRDDATVVVQLIDELFAVERRAKSWDILKQLREAESGPIVDRIKQWCEIKHRDYLLSDDEMGKAIRYVLSNWKELTEFLSDTRIPLSNNDAERALRQAVLGRKNYYGSKTIDGADAACVHFTIIETCKKVQLEPEHYYRYLVKTNNVGEAPLSPLSYVRWKHEQKKGQQAADAAASP